MMPNWIKIYLMYICLRLSEPSENCNFHINKSVSIYVKNSNNMLKFVFSFLQKVDFITS